MAEYVLSIRIDDRDLTKGIQRIRDAFGEALRGGMAVGGMEPIMPRAEKPKPKSTEIVKEVSAAVENRFGGIRKSLDKLKGAFGGGENEGGDGGAKISGMKRVREILGKINNKQVKLTGISFGIGMITEILTGMSDILGHTLELFQTAVKLMIRPIADFIGLLLQPIVLLLYQWLIVPFYQEVYPKIIDLAKYINSGQAFEDLKTDIDERIDKSNYNIKKIMDADSWDDVAKGLVGLAEAVAPLLPAFSGVVLGADAISKRLQEVKDDVVDLDYEINTDVISDMEDHLESAGKSWKGVSEWFGEVGKSVLAIKKQWNSFVAWMGMLHTSINNTLGKAYAALVGWFGDVSRGISSTLTSAWSTLTTWFSGVARDATNTLTAWWDGIKNAFMIMSVQAAIGMYASWRKIKTFFENLASDVSSVVLAGWEAFVDMIRRLTEIDVVKVVQDWLDSMKLPDVGGWFSKLLGSIKMPSMPKTIGGRTTPSRPSGFPTNPNRRQPTSPGRGGTPPTKVKPPKPVKPPRKVGPIVPPKKPSDRGRRLPPTYGRPPPKKPPKNHNPVRRFFAGGGILDEPVLGIGLRSGGDYVMGEAGREYVVPESKINNIGGDVKITINATVRGQADIEMIVKKVKAALQKDQRRLGPI